MNSNGSVSKDAVIGAVQKAIDQLPGPVQATFALHPVPSGVTVSSEGDWVVPVASGASLAMNKSYELHRVLSDIQEKVEDQLGVLLSITLES